MEVANQKLVKYKERFDHHKNHQKMFLSFSQSYRLREILSENLGGGI
jgi:hypothetical protein